MALINEEHKDRVFKFIFGNPDNKEWTLNLYNAVNGSDYKNPDDIEFNTIENAVYLGMKNDVCATCSATSHSLDEKAA